MATLEILRHVERPSIGCLVNKQYPFISTPYLQLNIKEARLVRPGLSLNVTL